MSEDGQKIVSLRGDVAPGQTNPEVVSLLRKYLDQAERGEIDGIAIAASRPNDRIAQAWHYGEASFRLVAAVTALYHAIGRSIEYSERDVSDDAS